MQTPTPLIDRLFSELPIDVDPMQPDDGRLDELWSRYTATLSTDVDQLGAAGSVTWDYRSADCTIEDPPEKVLAATPVLHHLAGWVVRVNSCTRGDDPPEVSGIDRRCGIDRVLTEQLEVYATANNVCPPPQLNVVDSGLRLVGAIAGDFQPVDGWPVRTPWLADPAGIVGFTPQELVLSSPTRDTVFDAPSNRTFILDEFRFVFTFTFPGVAVNTNSGIAP